MEQEPTNSANRVKELLSTLAKTYLARQQYSEAYNKFKHLLTISAETPELLMDASIAGMGVNNASEEACDIYQKAVKMNPESKALLLGLATLFVEQKVHTAFAIDICTRAADLSTDHSERIYDFLKEYYESIGKKKQARQQEKKIVSVSHDFDTIYEYLETLWFDEKFNDAQDVLKNIAETNKSDEAYDRALALTQAYTFIAKRQKAQKDKDIDVLFSGLETISPSNSLQDLRHYLTLRACFPRTIFTKTEETDLLEEFKFILGLIPIEEFFNKLKNVHREKEINHAPFDLKEEVLSPLKKIQEQEQQESIPACFKSILIMHVLSQQKSAPSKKLMHLISTHLGQIEKNVVRKTDTGFISLAEDPLSLLTGVVKLLQSLDDYNRVTDEFTQVRCNCALVFVRERQQNENSHLLTKIVHAVHLQRIQELDEQESHKTGRLWVEADKSQTDHLVSHRIRLIPKGKKKLLPGYSTNISEVIWRNPLANLEASHSYKLSDFEIQQRLSEHTHYATYLGIDRRLERNVILKVISPQDSVPYLQNRKRLNDLFETIRSIGTLSHPNIATLLDLGEYDGMIYFVREYVEGTSITKYDFPDNRETEIIAMLLKIARALKYSQTHRISHLNIKPENIWVTESGGIKITDFRFSSFSNNTTESEDNSLTQYRAPEILSGTPGDERSDIYSFGNITYELIAGSHPHDDGDLEKTIKEKFLPLTKEQSPWFMEWNELLSKATHTDPTKRLQNFSELETELKHIQLTMLQKGDEKKVEGEV
ncbi:MAG: protein kinase [bacterium]